MRINDDAWKSVVKMGYLQPQKEWEHDKESPTKDKENTKDLAAQKIGICLSTGPGIEQARMFI